MGRAKNYKDILTKLDEVYKNTLDRGEDAKLGDYLSRSSNKDARTNSTPRRRARGPRWIITSPRSLATPRTQFLKTRGGRMQLMMISKLKGEVFSRRGAVQDEGYLDQKP